MTELPAAAISRAPGLGWPRWARVDVPTLLIWILAGALVLYLGLNGGGYDLVVRSDAAVIVWWVLLAGAVLGVLPALHLSRRGWVAVGLFGAFVGWTALAATWSLSRELSLAELSRVTAYLGVLVLAMITYGDRRRALQHVVGAVATAATTLIALAVLSRLSPGLFPAARTTASFLPGTHARLDWPLNYWNALGAMVALTLPLALAIATSARSLVAQAAAAAALPLTLLCGYLTFSRGGAIAGALGLVAFILLAPDRIFKLATLLTGAAGGAALIAGAAHRHAVEQGLAGSAASRQGHQLLVAVVIVCAGVAVAQVAIGLLARHARLPRGLRIAPRQAGALCAVFAVLALVVAIGAGGPHRLSHAWQQFKQPSSRTLNQDALARFGSLSGNDRYAYWKTGLDAMSGHWLKGYGPGTFQLVWLPRAPYFSYVRNAHSLYVETLTDLGLVGLALLGGFLLFVLGSALHRVIRGHPEQRAWAAAAFAACAAFSVSAAFDWIWQVPVIPVAVLLLAAAVLAPLRPRHDRSGSLHSRTSRRRWRVAVQRVGLAVVAAAALAAIGVPLASTAAVRRSQAAAAGGDLPAAVADANAAMRVSPGAASPRLQLALVLEAQGKVRAAETAARGAVSKEPQNWQLWLVLSRLRAEAGDARGALAAYRRARALNPQSPLFHL